jgi:hypothetical protein
MEPEDEIIFNKLSEITGMSKASWAKKVIKDSLPTLSNLADALERTRGSFISGSAVFDDVFNKSQFDDSQSDIEDAINNQKAVTKKAHHRAKLKAKTPKKRAKK